MRSCCERLTLKRKSGRSARIAGASRASSLSTWQDRSEIKSVVLRDGDEHVGPHHASVGTLPSDQRLRADPASRRQFDDRLVGQVELAVAQRRTDHGGKRTLLAAAPEHGGARDCPDQQRQRQQLGEQGIGALLVFPTGTTT